MKYDKAKFVAEIKKAAEDTSTAKTGRDGATSGRVCAIATLRFARQAMLEDLGVEQPDLADKEAVKADKAQSWSAEDIRTAIKDSFLEIIQELNAKCPDGFASNASAAAKAAGYKADSAGTVAAPQD